jgi:hypothetical protein
VADEPVPEQILEAFVTRLEGMSRHDGYRMELRRVSRKWESLEQQNDLPVALVLRASGSPEHQYEELAGAGELGIGETGELIRAFLDVEVWLYCQGDDVSGPSTVWERLAADVERVLSLDLHLGLSPDMVWDVRKIGNIGHEPVPTQSWYRVEGADLYRASYQYLRGAP